MRGNTHNGGSRIVMVLAATAAGVLGGCGDDDESAVTGSIPGRPGTTTASTTASDVEPWIAYTIWSPTDEPEGVALVHPDGSDDHEILSELPYPALNPDWSPDGTRLALQVYSQDNIWIANADGSASEVVAPCTASCVVLTDPAWSPSGEAAPRHPPRRRTPNDGTAPAGSPPPPPSSSSTCALANGATSCSRRFRSSSAIRAGHPTGSPTRSLFGVTTTMVNRPAPPSPSAGSTAHR